MKVIYGITADMCRKNAVQCARAIEKCQSEYETTPFATLGTFWATLGLLTHALGDPDDGKIVGVEQCNG